MASGPADHEVAYAKINLALHVRSKGADGYHAIETLFAFAEDGDRLGAVAADTLSLAVSGPFAAALARDDPADNLVLRAAEALRAAFAVPGGAAITLDKRLPVASGIGGGSADAAAALRLLCRLWRIDAGAPAVAAIAQRLGADVPACLASTTVRGVARGDRLHPVAADGVRGLSLLLVNPGVKLSTAAVFGGWDGVDRGGLADGPVLPAAIAGRNDLEPPAVALVGQIAAVLTAMRASAGAQLARMSGSGATCFALYAGDDARDAAADTIRRTNPDWWTLATCLR